MLRQNVIVKMIVNKRNDMECNNSSLAGMVPVNVRTYWRFVTEFRRKNPCNVGLIWHKILWKCSFLPFFVTSGIQ